eukprot:1928670-Rhodomonas_salina.1
MEAATKMKGSVKSVAVYLSPSGIQFKRPITITLPYFEGVDESLGNQVLWLHTYNAKEGLWERKEQDPDKGWRTDIDASGTKVIRGQTNSFSLYAVLAVAPDPEPSPLPEADSGGGMSQLTTMLLLFLFDMALFVVFFSVMAVFWCKRAKEWKATGKTGQEAALNAAEDEGARDLDLDLDLDHSQCQPEHTPEDDGSGVTDDVPMGQRVASDGSDDTAEHGFGKHFVNDAGQPFKKPPAAPARLYLAGASSFDDDEQDRASMARPSQNALDTVEVHRSPA